MTSEDSNSNPSGKSGLFRSKRNRLFGRDSGRVTGTLFRSNAAITILILTLITVFLVKEGSSFIWRYHTSLQEYRRSGLEYANIVNRQYSDFAALARFMDSIRADWIESLQARGISGSEIDEIIATSPLQKVFSSYRGIGNDLQQFTEQKQLRASTTRDAVATNESLSESIGQLESTIRRLKPEEAEMTGEDGEDFTRRIRAYLERNRLNISPGDELLVNARGVLEGGKFSLKIKQRYIELLRDDIAVIGEAVQSVNIETEREALTGDLDTLKAINQAMASDINAALGQLDQAPVEFAMMERQLEVFKSLNLRYLNGLPDYERELEEWDPLKPVPYTDAMVSFLAGKKWITSSARQDLYGLLPFLTGSLLVGFIALAIAFPLGVGGAIYVNQIASPAERKWIKPYIDFFSAVPSVVLGFFGVFVLGGALQFISHSDVLSWVPFFPIQERLNAFTAGCLLAMMAIPTIFNRSEAAIDKIPTNLAEASFALGATRLQTTMHITVPAALSGIISAVIIGFGRVIGETMIVLLCAGNRIEIPDFTQGLGTVFTPVHTMTGIIAQEMGEVVRNSLHYRSLFMIAVVLFLFSLTINICALWVVRRFRKVGE